MEERGASEDEVRSVVEQGEKFPAKFGRVGFRKNIPFDQAWRGKRFHTKQLEVYAVQEGDGWLVITVLTRYY